MKKPATTHERCRPHAAAIRIACAATLATVIAACSAPAPPRPADDGPMSMAEARLGTASGAPTGATAPRPAGPLLFGVDWIFTWLDGYDGPLPGPAPVPGFSITIEGSRMTGSTACNSMLSGYELDEAAGKLRFTGLVNGQILCQRALADTEEAVLDAMLSTDSFALVGDTLELRGKGKPLARLSTRGALVAEARAAGTTPPATTAAAGQ